LLRLLGLAAHREGELTPSDRRMGLAGARSSASGDDVDLRAPDRIADRGDAKRGLGSEARLRACQPATLLAAGKSASGGDEGGRNADDRLPLPVSGAPSSDPSDWALPSVSPPGRQGSGAIRSRRQGPSPPLGPIATS
jgi:hypothetical protein